MIGLLTGNVIHEEPTGALILDVRGVGYELACPVGTRGRAQEREGALTLHVHTNLRQDALELFGFCSGDERTTFRQLISIPNVGPKLAISILSSLPSLELAEAIEREDKVRLSKIPGVGKKTAERLVLELRGKLKRPALHSSSVHQPAPDLSAKLVSALVGLGYKPNEAERAAVALAEETSTRDLAVLIRKALAFLAS